MIFFVSVPVYAENAKKPGSKSAVHDEKNEEEKKKKSVNFLKYMDRHSEEYSALYIPRDKFIYRKVKIDTGAFFVTAPVQKKNTDDKRNITYPELMCSIEYWQKRYLGFYFDYSAGFLGSDSENTGELMYYPTTMNLSAKYRVAVEYSQTSPYFNFELGYHYHDLRYRVKSDELFKRIYKGPYIGLERKIPLGEDFGFFFEINYMPYLFSSDYEDSENTPDKAMGIHFLASGYMTIKFKKKDMVVYRLKLYGGFAQRDYFTEVKNSSIAKSRLDQRYSSFFLLLSQEI